MQDEGTYGFNKRDAEDTIARNGNVDVTFESRVPHAIGDMQLGRTTAGGIPLGAAATVYLYEESSGGWTVTTNEVQCWTFPTAIVGTVDVAIWESGTRLVAFELC
jgi:hypothetical protein